MNLSFSVLWFDDRREYLDSIDQDALGDTIMGWGFRPYIQLVDEPAEFLAHKPFDKFDLIVVDYNLGDNQHGQDFIQEIREHNVLTEVIFYSANPAKELWDAIRAKELEGVYVSGRDQVISKVERVGRQSLHKVLDLNNVRGIIMAELADLDAQLDVLFTAGWQSLPDPGRAYISQRFVKAIREQAADQAAKVDRCEAEPSSEGLIALSDSSKRWDNLCRLQKKHEQFAGVVLPPFAAEILKPRNFLAHGVPREEGTDLIFSFGGKEYVYNEEVGVALRQTIMKYRDQLETLQAKLG